jgi:DNA-binding NtrC family response regulator
MTGRPSDPANEFRLLIVDDDEQILLLLGKLLAEEEVYRISTASDPRNALDLLRASPFDLLVADHRMPEMTGIELIRHAKRLHPDLIAILITGFAGPDVTVEAAEAGAYDVMLKPLNLGVVRVRVRNALERVRLLREIRRYRSELEQARKGAVRGGTAKNSSDPMSMIELSPPALLSRGGARNEEQVLNQLERLGKLCQTGLLTKEEFMLKKAKLFKWV